MGKPRLIIIIRHAQSEGNKNREIHQTVPDHRVKLTLLGWEQAHAAGTKLRSLLRPDDTLHFFTSPYRRTRETTEGILSTLTSNEPTPSPFPRHKVKVYEEPRLREQDFGNFQPDSAAMSKMWHERAAYGHFFYRIPNGESAADCYDRISGFNESLWRSFGYADFPSVCVLVTHGLMARVFLMKWYHFSVDYFEDLRNIEHCEFLVMAKNEEEGGKYVLRNHLRTWSEYRQEKGLEAKSPVPVRKKWGVGDGGETERAWQPRRQNTADLFVDDGEKSLSRLEEGLRKKEGKTRDFGEVKLAPEDDGDDGEDERADGDPSTATVDGLSAREAAEMEQRAGKEASTDDNGGQLPRPVASKSKKDLDRVAYLRTGRDGGGSRSGVASPNVSDDEEEVTPKKGGLSERSAQSAHSLARPARPVPRSMARALSGTLNTSDGLDHEAKADALGDQSDMDDEEDEVEGADKSFAGSVR